MYSCKGDRKFEVYLVLLMWGALSLRIKPQKLVGKKKRNRVRSQMLGCDSRECMKGNWGTFHGTLVIGVDLYPLSVHLEAHRANIGAFVGFLSASQHSYLVWPLNEQSVDLMKLQRGFL